MFALYPHYKLLKIIRRNSWKTALPPAALTVTVIIPPTIPFKEVDIPSTFVIAVSIPAYESAKAAAGKTKVEDTKVRGMTSLANLGI